MAKIKRAQNTSYRIFDDILALAGSLLRSRKDLGADKLHTLAQATRDYAASLTDMPTLRAHATSASESLEGLAEYVMHTDIEHMVTDANNFARKHPLAALGVTVAAGIVASRLMRPASVSTTTGPRRSTSKKKKAKPVVRARRGTNGSAQPHA
jgi:ElaB/YqjD/DUF883 family membrane-anchored ribosome-binding protein